MSLGAAKWTPEQMRLELYAAWRKDTREPATPETFKRYRALVDAGIRDREIVLRNADLGANFALVLASVLPKSGINKIDLQNNRLHDSGAEAVAHILRETPTLTHLNIGSNDIGPPGLLVLSAVVATHKRLQALLLGSGPHDAHVNRIDSASGTAIVHACSQCKTLKVLDLNRTPIGQGSQEPFMEVAALVSGSSSLQALRLGETEIAVDSALAVVDAARRSSSLAELQLQGNKISPRVGDALGNLLTERGKRIAPSPLKTLILHSNPTLGSAGAASIFRGLALDKGLTTLTMHGCHVDDNAVTVLCESLDSNGTLTSLDLHSNLITSTGAAEIARSLLGHPALQLLNISDNKLRDEGACALASMLETNRVLESIRMDAAWIGDRGAVALGVVLANNTTLRVLSLESNHLTEDGGSALTALLSKNHQLLDVNIKGNAVFHSTAAKLKKIIDRNNATRQADVPNKLKREVVRLHYQLYKLEEAKAELELHRNRKNEIERAQERFDAQFREEEAEYVKKKKDLEDGIRDQELACDSLDKQLKTLNENFERFKSQNEAELQIVEERLEHETRERQAAEEELSRVQGEITGIETQREKRMDDMRRKIEEARIDRERWAAQAKEARARTEIAAEKLRQLESQIVSKESSSAAAPGAAARRGTARRRSTAASAAADAINALLNQQPPAAASSSLPPPPPV